MWLFKNFGWSAQDKMQQSPETPKPPRKRTPVKKQPSVWFEPASKLSHIPDDLGNLHSAVEALQKRLASLEQEWQDLLEHLSQQEDSMDSTQEEEEQN